MEINRHMDAATCQGIQVKFEAAVKLIREKLGDGALKRSGTFMLTRFDALMVGLMSLAPNHVFQTAGNVAAALEERLGARSIHDRIAELERDTKGLNEQGEEIDGLSDDQRGYVWSVAKFTNDTNRVSVRLRVAKEVFADQ